MRRALLAFIAGKLLLVGLLAFGPRLEEVWLPEGAETPFRGTETHERISWKGNPEVGHYLYHPSRLLDAWFRHDSAFYVQIAYMGYGPVEQRGKTREGFFPGYPLLMRMVGRALDPMVEGLHVESMGNSERVPWWPVWPSATSALSRH